MENGIRGCVFDLDGTLADTAPDIAVALNSALREVGQPPLPVQEVVTLIGGGIPTLVDRAVAKLGAPTSIAGLLVDRMLYHYNHSFCVETRAMTGVVTCLEALKQRGMPMAVCTNKDQAIAHKIVEALGLDSYFIKTIGRQPNVPKKPDPAMLMIAAECLECSVETVVMIGDSDVDAQTARAAGSTAVILRNGYFSGDHGEIGADHLIDDMTGLLPLLDDLSDA
jgi:phosphoglycolate phosphatase